MTGARLLILAVVAAGALAGGTFAVVQPARQPPASTEPPPESFARVFEPCAHCHQIGPGARSMVGPPLQDLIGRQAGTATAYPYSQVMRESGFTWTSESLDHFIAAPQAVVPGTRMMFPGIEDPARRAALVAFIAAPKAD